MKGVILENKGEGLYKVRLHEFRYRLEMQIEFIERKLEELMELYYKEKYKVFETDEDGNPLVPDETKIVYYLARHSTLERKLLRLKDLPENDEIDCWIADYSIDLPVPDLSLSEIQPPEIVENGGDIDAVEIAVIGYTRDGGLNILPGYPVEMDDKLINTPSDADSYMEDIPDRPDNFPRSYLDHYDDNYLNPIMERTLVIDPMTAYYNAIMLPFAIRHRPRYRYATITDIDYGQDKANIILEPVLFVLQGTSQAIDLNREQAIDNVPIIYMNCNSAAFQINDVVLLWFESYEWENAFIIGFKQEPRPCSRCFLDGVIAAKTQLIDFDHDQYKQGYGHYPFTGKYDVYQVTTNSLTGVLCVSPDYNREYAIGDRVIVISQENCACAFSCENDYRDPQQDIVLTKINKVRKQNGKYSFATNTNLLDCLQDIIDGTAPNQDGEELSTYLRVNTDYLKHATLFDNDIGSLHDDLNTNAQLFDIDFNPEYHYKPDGTLEYFYGKYYGFPIKFDRFQMPKEHLFTDELYSYLDSEWTLENFKDIGVKTVFLDENTVDVLILYASKNINANYTILPLDYESMGWRDAD